MKKIGIIGCGLRTECYVHELRNDFGKRIEIVALADPDQASLDAYLEVYGNGKDIKTYSNGAELIEDNLGNLDVVIIGSPNFCHGESFIPAVENDLVILLEKPVGHTFDECKKMWQAYRAHPDSVVSVGFVLRYTKFYQKIKEILDQGTIGEILTVHATESLGVPLTDVFVRGEGKWAWRSSAELSGSFLLEKCCHDMDMLSFLISDKPEKVSSFARRSYFVPNQELPERCRECSITDDCKYYAPKFKKYQIGERREGSAMSSLLPSADNDLCVFNSPKDIPDHQTVMLEYSRGVLATFTATMNQPKTTRTIRIEGSEGQIVGDIRENSIEIRRHAENGEQAYEREFITIEHDDSGHDGGDSILTNNFRKMILENSSSSLAGIREGVEAALIVFAAEQSCSENKMVDMKELYESMFGENS